MLRLLLVFIMTFISPAWAMRVISTSPALTEMVTELNHEGSLVGVTPYCLDGKNVKKIGTALELDLEQVLMLKPDVVLLQENTPGKTHSDLSKLGVKVIALPLIRLSDIQKAWGELSKFLEQKNDFLETQMTRLKQLKRTGKVAIILGGVPEKSLMLSGKNTYYDDIITAIGLSNASDSHGWPLIDAETARAYAANNVMFLELVSDKKKGWTKEQWQHFCPSCQVKTIRDDRILYPGVKMLKSMIDFMERIDD